MWSLIKLEPEVFALSTGSLDLDKTQTLVCTEGVVFGLLTVRPCNAFSNSELDVPALPKTLLSSRAETLQILLPTRCWRRKCTHLATEPHF
jgi:hypothetical protein